MTGASTTTDTVTTGNLVTEAVREIVRWYRRRDFAAKKLADVCDASPRTTEEWLQGRSLPTSAETLMRLAAEHRELQAVLNLHIERLRHAADMKKLRRKAHEEMVRKNSAATGPRSRPRDELD